MPSTASTNMNWTIVPIAAAARGLAIKPTTPRRTTSALKTNTAAPTVAVKCAAK
jgi:hypothetical protein